LKDHLHNWCGGGRASKLLKGVVQKKKGRRRQVKLEKQESGESLKSNIPRENRTAARGQGQGGGHSFHEGVKKNEAGPVAAKWPGGASKGGRPKEIKKKWS